MEFTTDYGMSEDKKIILLQSFDPKKQNQFNEINKNVPKFLNYEPLKIGLRLQRPSAPLHKKTQPLSTYFGKNYQMFFIPSKNQTNVLQL